MLDYSKMKNTICSYEVMRKEMVQGVPKEIAEHILSMTTPFEVGGVKYVDRKAVDRCAREVLGLKKSGRTSKDEEQTDTDNEELERKEEENKRLRKQLSDMEAQFAEAAEAEKVRIQDMTARIAKSDKELNALSVAYNDMYKERQTFEASLEQERQARRAADKRTKELQDRIAQSDKEHAETVRALNGRLTNLNKQYTELKKSSAEQPQAGDATSKAGLKQQLKEANKALDEKRAEVTSLQEEIKKLRADYEALKSNSTSKKIADMGLRITTLEKCFEEKTEECEMLEDEINELNKRLSEAKDVARANEQTAKRLQDALDNVKASSSERHCGNVFDTIPEYYSGEVLDFIGYLARQRLAMLPDEDASSYRRERDICENISSLAPDSGSQKSLASDIEEAVRMKFDKNSNAGLLSLGFGLESSNNHDKFVLTGVPNALADRITLVFAKTPSDRKAREKATSNLIKMLTFGSISQKEPAKAEEKKSN